MRVELVLEGKNSYGQNVSISCKTSPGCISTFGTFYRLFRLSIATSSMASLTILPALLQQTGKGFIK